MAIDIKALDNQMDLFVEEMEVFNQDPEKWGPPVAFDKNEIVMVGVYASQMVVSEINVPLWIVNKFKRNVIDDPSLSPYFLSMMEAVYGIAVLRTRAEERKT